MIKLNSLWTKLQLKNILLTEWVSADYVSVMGGIGRKKSQSSWIINSWNGKLRVVKSGLCRASKLMSGIASGIVRKSKKRIFTIKDEITRVKPFLGISLIILLWINPACAHLMQAQKGSLNFTSHGAFLVLSLPVSAFSGIDDDRDEKMSVAEFTRHRKRLAELIQNKIKLYEYHSDKNKPNNIYRDAKSSEHALEGLMLSPVLAHGAKTAPTRQLVIMGRFPIQSLNHHYQIRVGLFGKAREEQTFTLRAKHLSRPGKHKVVLTPKRHQEDIFVPTDSPVSTPISISEQRISQRF